MKLLEKMESKIRGNFASLSTSILPSKIETPLPQPLMFSKRKSKMNYLVTSPDLTVNSNKPL